MAPGFCGGLEIRAVPRYPGVIFSHGAWGVEGRSLDRAAGVVALELVGARTAGW